MAKELKDKKPRKSVLTRYDTGIVEVEINGAKIKVPNYIAINLKANSIKQDDEKKLEIKRKLDELEVEDKIEIDDDDLELQTEFDILEDDTDQLDDLDKDNNN